MLDPFRADGRPERFLGLSHQQGFALMAVAAAVLWQLVAQELARRERSEQMISRVS